MSTTTDARLNQLRPGQQIELGRSPDGAVRTVAEHAATLTEKIRALRDGAISAGNLALVSTCEIALRPAGELDVLAPTASGAPWRDDLAVLAARAECADAILDATVRAEADAYIASCQPGAPQETLVAEAVAVAATRSALAAHDAALGEYERAADLARRD